MIVAHNLLASNANRNLGLSTGSIKKHTEKLSSGYKINRAADDAAGLTISEKMRSQIRGLTQASSNAQDGISFVQTADGTLDEVSAMLKRTKELGVKASTGTLTDADRQAIQAEVKSICDEIDRVQQSSTFNDFRIFSEGGYPPSEAKVVNDVIPVTVSMIDAGGNRVESTTPPATTGTANTFAPGSNEEKMANFVKDAVNNAVGKLQSAYTGLMSAASTSGVEIGLLLGNIDGSGKTLAQIEAGKVTTGSSTTLSYTLHVDTTDYNPNTIDSWTDAKKSDLAATIAHEMTHAIMVDTMPNGMFGSLPQWFVEGTAQTSSGDNGWVRRNPSDEYLQNKIKDLYGNPYGTGYLAAMYLGHLAGGGDAAGSSISPSTIKSGLDKVLTAVAKGKSLSDAIKDSGTGFDDLSSFEKAFINGNDNVFQFAKNLMGQVGSNGAGSLLGSLSDPENAVFPASMESTLDASNYNLNTSTQKVGNGYNGAPVPVPASESYGDGKGRDIYLQVGAANREEQRIKVKRFNISCDALFEGYKIDMSTVDNARNSLEYIDKADANVSSVRSYYGAIQNRLEHTIANLDNIVENTTAAESQIRDTDMAKEMVDYTKMNVLIQAGNAMLAQAMQTPQNVLQLLS